MRLLPLAALLVLVILLGGACEDGAPLPDAATYGDLAVVAGDAGALDLSAMAATAKVSGIALALDEISYAQGVAISLEGYDASSSSDVNGGFHLTIPAAACGRSVRLRASGMVASGLVVIPLARAPAFVADCTKDLDLHILHVALADPSPTGLRSTVARELAAHGDLVVGDAGDAAAALQHDYNWAYGRFLAFDGAGEHSFVDGMVSVSSDGGLCRVYYAQRYATYRSQKLSHLIEFGAASTPGNVLVLCPRTVTAPITLTASGFVTSDDLTPATFDPITFALLPDGMVSIEWSPSAF